MSKITITWISIAAVVIVIAAGAGWWYFGKTNSTIIRPSGPSGKLNSSAANAQVSAKLINSFVFSGLAPEVDGIIDNTNHTVNLIVPAGTEVTNLVPNISVSDGANVSPASDAPQNFTKPVAYTVTAKDGSTQSYKVTVIIATAPGTGGS
ncbi:MAG: DUF5018 domain-containing protein [Candidatus Staskawiczbacteria bacterium]|jgi:hypothetical protein